MEGKNRIKQSICINPPLSPLQTKIDQLFLSYSVNNFGLDCDKLSLSDDLNQNLSKDQIVEETSITKYEKKSYLRDQQMEGTVPVLCIPQISYIKNYKKLHPFVMYDFP